MDEELEIKQAVIDALKNKKAKDYYADMQEAEQGTIRSLMRLPNWGRECDCENDNIAEVGEGTYCLNCGGFIEYEEEWEGGNK